MPRPATVWWNKQRGSWCTDVGGTRHILAKGKANKTLAWEKLKELIDEQALLLVDMNGAITVAAMCDAFLAQSGAADVQVVPVRLPEICRYVRDQGGAHNSPDGHYEVHMRA